MNANQMVLAAQDVTVAFGPCHLQPVIAGRKVTLIEFPGNRVTVIDDRQAAHDFIGCTWAEIKASMEEYFGVVDNGR